jgi:hypothetical protein
MDFSKILSVAGSIPGASKLLGNLAGLGDIEALKAKAAQQLGISATALDEFAKEAQEILADGKITADEVKTKLSALGAAKGIPQQAIDMALKMMQERAGK